jgi:hypothetical protein
MKSMFSPNHSALPPPNSPAAFLELLTITHQNGTRKYSSMKPSTSCGAICRGLGCTRVMRASAGVCVVVMRGNPRACV